MRKIIFVFSFVFLFSCNDLVEKPDRLISQDKFGDILVDIAINEQSGSVNPNGNMELSTRYILKKHQISAKEFGDSFEYYTLNKSLPKIIQKAQDQLIKNHPELKTQLKEKERKKTLQESKKGKDEFDLLEKTNDFKNLEELKHSTIKRENKSKK